MIIVGSETKPEISRVTAKAEGIGKASAVLKAHKID
jgi:hypothetical protein